MDEIKMLEVLKRLRICIERDSLMIAKDLVQLEINNLKGLTEKNCKNTRYYYDNCKFCSNLNCNQNSNK